MSKNNIIIIVVVIIAAFVGYKFFSGSGDTATTSGLSAEKINTQVAGAELLSTINSLNSIDLVKNVGFLRTRAFTSLKEETGEKFSVQDIGRNNPFSPLAKEQLK